MTQIYGLALGGGGARGYAHIGAIQYLQENNIAIKEVAGTSIGALIAAMYAYGISAKKMENVFSDLSYGKLFDRSINGSVFGGKRLSRRLEQIFRDARIQDCEIALRIAACNIKTGQEVVFGDGSIVQALRASLAFPGLVTPAEINGDFFVDGGIVDNLPIDLLESNHVIAISVVDTVYENIESSHTFLGFSLPRLPVMKTSRAMSNSVNIMLKRIEDLSILASDKNIRLIRPNMNKYTMFDMEKLDEIISLGYEETAVILSGAQ